MTAPSWPQYFREGTEVVERTLPSGLHVRSYERGTGDVALFLHGFPELAVSWRHQLGALSEHYRCVVPDMPGYGGTGCPPSLEGYTLPRLAGYVDELIAALGVNAVHLIGHDWGGALAWQMARQLPTRVASLSVLNCPPDDVMLAELLSRPAQLRMSWYMAFFQLPWLPEWALRRDPDTSVPRAFLGVARNRTVFDPHMLAPYIEQVKTRGLPGLNYYRAALRSRARGPRPLITAPTQLIWGLGDGALGPWFTDEAKYAHIVRELRVTRIEEAGHWVQQEAPERVNLALLQHLQAHPI